LVQVAANIEITARDCLHRYNPDAPKFKITDRAVCGTLDMTPTPATRRVWAVCSSW
jgi:hypothetical protein